MAAAAELNLTPFLLCPACKAQKQREKREREAQIQLAVGPTIAKSSSISNSNNSNLATMTTGSSRGSNGSSREAGRESRRMLMLQPGEAGRGSNCLAPFKAGAMHSKN